MAIYELKKVFDKTAKLAAEHREAGAEFNVLCEEYYGVEWHTLPTIADNDDIIDTIDYGTTSLSFEEFNKLVRSAIEGE